VIGEADQRCTRSSARPHQITVSRSARVGRYAAVVPLAPHVTGHGLVAGEQGVRRPVDRPGLPRQTGIHDAEGEGGGRGTEVVFDGGQESAPRDVRILADDQDRPRLRDERDRPLRGAGSGASAIPWPILFKDVPPVVAAIAGAPRKELITFRDGGPPKGDPCEPSGYHGYPDIESRVVIGITDWIKAIK
jgi:hypothetical protein